MNAPTAGAGWFDDPTGRFGRRWYDGSAWTDHVVGANGQGLADPLPASDVPFPPPSPVVRTAPPPPRPGFVPAPPAGPHPPPFGGPGPRAHGFGPPPPSSTRRAPAGLAVGVLGLVLVVLGLLVLPWAESDASRFTDLSGAYRDAGSAAVDDTLLYTYVAWGGFVLLALVAVAVMLACVPVPPSAAGNSGTRVVGAVLAGGAAVIHTVTVTALFRGPATPEVGAWAAVAGYALVGVAMVLGARRPAR